MNTKLIKTPISGLLVVEIDYFKDERGFFIESWHKRDFANAGIDVDFVQD
jgi:dTDP-4-dehydrorhamnose 3,5-epimerase